MDRKKASEQDIAKALKKYNSDNHPRGETLPGLQFAVIQLYRSADIPGQSCQDLSSSMCTST